MCVKGSVQFVLTGKGEMWLWLKDKDVVSQ